MRARAAAVLLAILCLVACGESGNGDTVGGSETSTGDDVISFLGNAAMDEFQTAWEDYRTYYDENQEAFDPTTAASFGEYVREARATSKEFLVRIERLAEAHAPLPALFEAEIALGRIPEDEVEDLRELIEAYGTWIDYERQENEEFLDCLELAQLAPLVECLEESVTTTVAQGDEVARRIFELQEILYGVTVSPSA